MTIGHRRAFSGPEPFPNFQLRPEAMKGTLNTGATPNLEPDAEPEPFERRLSHEKKNFACKWGFGLFGFGDS